MSQLVKELRRFIIAGICAVGTDFITYYILKIFFSNNVSKSVSFILGTIVAYIINKYWTFEKHERSYKEMLQFVILYSCTLCANVFTNKVVLESTSLVFLGFILATGVSTILNFLGQKLWVFK